MDVSSRQLDVQSGSQKRDLGLVEKCRKYNKKVCAGAMGGQCIDKGIFIFCNSNTS